MTLTLIISKIRFTNRLTISLITNPSAVLVDDLNSRDAGIVLSYKTVACIKRKSVVLLSVSNTVPLTTSGVSLVSPINRLVSLLSPLRQVPGLPRTLSSLLTLL